MAKKKINSNLVFAAAAAALDAIFAGEGVGMEWRCTRRRLRHRRDQPLRNPWWYPAFHRSLHQLLQPVRSLLISPFSSSRVDLVLSFGGLWCSRVYEDEEEWFRSIFANSRKEDAIQNQYEFFVQRMGGPPLYSQRKGTCWFCFAISI